MKFASVNASTRLLLKQKLCACLLKGETTTQSQSQIATDAGSSLREVRGRS